MEKVLVSGCFLGQRVRYDGDTKTLDNQAISRWQAQGRIIAICPEVSGGLPTPRPPAEYQPSLDKVITCDGDDVTDAFERGAQNALRLCQQYNIRYALLKESSPSCGSTQVYNGTFNNEKVPGEGITTKLLRAHGIEVFSEVNVAELIAIIDRQ